MQRRIASVPQGVHSLPPCFLLLLYLIRGAAEDAFRWNLRLRCPLLAAWSNWGFYREKADGAGPWSFRNSRKSGIIGKAPKTRSGKPFSEWVYLFIHSTSIFVHAFSGAGPLLNTGDAAVKKTVSVPTHMDLTFYKGWQLGHTDSYWITIVLKTAEKNTRCDWCVLSRPLASLRKGQLSQHLQASKR